MKKLFLVIMGTMLLVLSACSTQNYLDPKTVIELVNGKQFTFMAKRANPTNYDVINVINSIPNSTSSRMLELDYGYGITFKDGELTSVLPYFGRTYTPIMDRDKQSYRFTSRNFSIEKKSGKKDTQILTIRPTDVDYVQRIIMEIYPNGKAYLSIYSNDRQPISYEGYLMENEVKK